MFRDRALETLACAFVAVSLWACDHDVSLGGCDSPGVQAIAVNQDPDYIAVDETSVYWTNLVPGGPGVAGTAAIVKTPLDGGAINTVATFSENGNGRIFVDSTYLYWVDDNAVPSASIMRVGKDGGTPTTVASALTVTGLTIDSANVYWSESNATGAAVVKADKVSRAPVTLVTLAALTYPGALAVDAANLYYSADINDGQGNHTGALMSVPILGGTPLTLASSTETFGPFAVAVAGGSVYYVVEPYPPPPSSRTGTLMKVPVGGGAAISLASEASAVLALAVDSANVYWGGPDLGLKSMPLRGGPQAVPAPCQFPVAITASGASLYWSNSHGAPQGDGSVMRVTPK